jgi:hypothetical protein
VVVGASGHDHHLFEVRRVDIECFARDLDDCGKARATVARRLCTIVARAVDPAVGERLEGPIFLDSNRERLDRQSHVHRRRRPLTTNTPAFGAVHGAPPDAGTPAPTRSEHPGETVAPSIGRDERRPRIVREQAPYRANRR